MAWTRGPGCAAALLLVLGCGASDSSGGAASRASVSAGSGGGGSIMLPSSNPPGLQMPAGSAGSGVQSGSPVDSGGWCDVQPIFSSSCAAMCHSAIPEYTAPMPLVTFADLHAPLKSNPAKQVYQGVGARIHNAQTPMPPLSAPMRLDTDALATLDAWIGAGAPMGTDTACIATTPVTQPGVGSAGAAAPPTTNPRTTNPPTTQPPATTEDGWPEDCAEHYRFTAGNYMVSAGQQFYANISIDAPWGQGSAQALRFKPIIDNTKVIHHYILYAADGSFVNGWAPGDQGITMPDTVGLMMPAGTYRLEVHYNNSTGTSSEVDDSGVELCVAKTPRPNMAAVHWLGSLAIFLAPHTSQDVPSTCTPQITSGPVHIISVSPHMHKTGYHAKMVLNRAGGEQVVIHDAAFSFDNQLKYDVPEDHSAPDVLVNPGDSIDTVCSFKNDTDATVTFGQKTEDEMCFFFTIAWPMGQLINGSVSPDGGSTSSCM